MRSKILRKYICESTDKMSTTEIKCVVPGDGAVGKTCMLYRYAQNEFLKEYIPNAYDYDTKETTVNGQTVQLQLWDTAGGEDYDRLRPLLYPNTSVFLLCFSVVFPYSFESIKDRWVPELEYYAADVPYLLIGTKSDLRNNPKYATEEVRTEEAEALEDELSAAKYVDCSALTGGGIEKVFQEAIIVAMEGNKNKRSLRRKQKMKHGRCSIT